MIMRLQYFCVSTDRRTRFLRTNPNRPLPLRRRRLFRQGRGGRECRGGTENGKTMKER